VLTDRALRAEHLDGRWDAHGRQTARCHMQVARPFINRRTRRARRSLCVPGISSAALTSRVAHPAIQT
jgi:hypothetical protein